MGSSSAIEVIILGDIGIREESEIELAQIHSEVNSGENGEESNAQRPPKLLLEAAGVSESVSKKGYGLKKWRRVHRELCNHRFLAADSAQMLKRSRVVGEFDLNADFLILGTGYSLGIGSQNAEVHSGVSLTTSGAPRKRSRVKKCRMKRLGRGMCRKVSREKEVEIEMNLTSSIESNLRTSGAGPVWCGDAFSNRLHSGMSMSYNREQSGGRHSEEVQSDYNKGHSGDEDLVTECLYMDQAGASVEESEGSWLMQDGDPFAESIALLRSTQEVLESEMQKLLELGREPELGDLNGGNKETDMTSLPGTEAYVLDELNQKLKRLEQKLEEASTTIKEKDSRLLELEQLLKSNQSPREMDSADLPFLAKGKEMESELESLLQKRMEAEIQYLVMAKTCQSWQFQAEDRIAFLEKHKSLAGDYTRMMLELRDTENKVVVLKEQVKKLEIHEKELFATVEVLKMQNRACKISFFSFIQFTMLCVALWMFLTQLLPHSGDVVLVPT